ncbi:MAG: hypothetical protein M1822_010012 [Bathelium mastoideum]|nr:MAG: hypothetical protein M1822_010012 [Bathelium mastoideum]
MPSPTWNAVYEVLLRHGVDPQPARRVAMTELRGWDLKDVAEVFKRIQRPSRDYCLLKTDLREVPPDSKAQREKNGLSLKRYWPSLWTPVPLWISPPRHMMERAAKEKAALCVNSDGQFEVRTQGYVALSHVWIEGLQRDPTHHGIPQSRLSLIFSILRRNGINAEWVWTDALAIPAGGAPTAKLEDELLTTDVINSMPSIYSNAQLVVILDALVLQLHPRNLEDVAAALVCGRWVYRVWTFQEIKLATEAMIITASGAYCFADVLQHLTEQVKTDPARFKRLHDAFAIMAKDDNTINSFPDLVFACRTRKAGLDIDHVRAFFPVLGLTWQAGTTRERGMHIIYTYYNIASPTRIINYAGAPRLKLGPGWAPSTLVGLEGVVTDPLVIEERGVRGDWYIHKVDKVIRTFTRREKLFFELEVRSNGTSLVQCVLTNESDTVIANITKAIENGKCFMLDAQPSTVPDAEFAGYALMAEKATTEEYDGFEVAVHAAAVVKGERYNSEPKQNILVRNGNPVVNGDSFNQTKYRLHTEDMRNKLPQREGESTLHAAVRASSVEKVEALLAQEDGQLIFDAGGWTPLHLAAARNDCAMLALFIKHETQFHLEIRGQNATQDTPLIVAAENDSTDVIHLLLKAGANVHTRNKHGNTPLMAAARKHRIDAVCALLDAGASAKDHNHDFGFFDTALTLACNAGAQDILPLLRALIDGGAEVNQEAFLGMTPLIFAIKRYPPNVVAYLLERGADPNFQPQVHTYSPLAFALGRNSEPIVRSLLDAGADVGRGRDDGSGHMFMPIHNAVGSKNYTILQMLLEKSPDVNAVAEPGGQTALHLAVVLRQLTMVKILLATDGCDRRKENATGLTALDVARELQDENLVRILEGNKHKYRWKC